MQVFGEMTIFEVSENGNDDVLRNYDNIVIRQVWNCHPIPKKWQLQIFLNDDIITFTREGEYERFLSANGVRTAFFALGFSCQQKSSILPKKYEKIEK